jgi:ribulose-5-phosphate 4-epimerase/fuculose-1-phosphate aldolase|tara:strand:- start:699 stop:1382 length:684 start_codon:yes stop_codon:yes gene_type:complete
MTTTISRVDELLDLAHKVSGFAICGEGNVSARIETSVLIKGSGTSLDTLSAKDLAMCSMWGKEVSIDGVKPSIEASFHAWILRTFPDLQFVAHTHPTNTLKILCSKNIYEFAELRMFPDQIVRNGPVSCVVPYATPGKDLMRRIIDSVEDYVELHKEFPKLILLQNHGIIVASSSVKECVSSTLMCEKSAEIYLGAKSSGKINFLSDDDVDEVHTCPNEKYRRDMNR